MKIRLDNNMADRVGVVYAKNDIKPNAICDEN